MHISYDNFENIILENVFIITLSKRNHLRKESAYVDDSVLRVC
jgi:small nuclear ribonucleoprotein (snRNP)-like protein